MKTFLRFFLFLLILLVGLAGLAFYWTFYRPLPDYQTTLEQPGLQQQVEIHWDSYGVPHIYGENRQDVYYSMGYVHAQDRLWQMTLNQMAAEGRFAEFLGEDLLPYDKLQRTLGFWRIAQKIEATLSERTRSYLQAYADGVNAYIRQHPKSLPIQFSLTEMDPIQWTPTHSIALARLMAWDLNVPWDIELTLAYLGEQLPPQQFRQLLPHNRFLNSTVSTREAPPADSASAANSQLSDTTTASASSPSEASSSAGDGTLYRATRSVGIQDSVRWANALFPLLQRQKELNKLRGIRGGSNGSNAWAISGHKSTTGAPLLAGDPHLGLSMPGTWYEVHLNADGQNLSGASLPGAPIVVLGQNDHLAWSFTNIMLDDTDFFEEALHPEDDRQYLVDSLAGDPVYSRFDVQQEVIKVKDGDDVLFTRKVSKHGPVISDILPEQQFAPDRVITMKWTGHLVSNEIDALLAMGWAQSFEEFRDGAERFEVPGQNMIYADRSGNIARLSQARVPVRAYNPVLLRKGWDPSMDWQGFVPQEQLPAVINPDKGWVANANNAPVDADYPYYLSVYWQSDARYDRIRQYLSQDQRLSPEAFQQMQLDSHSLFARDLAELILPVLKKSGDNGFETVISYLENWDYSYDASETAASIMDVFLLHFAENTLQDEMGEQVYQQFIDFSTFPSQALLHFLRNGSSFFDNGGTSQVESGRDMVIQSMQETMLYLQRNFGDEPFEWRWEQLHTLTLQPPLLGQAAQSPGAPAALKVIVANLLNLGPFPAPGTNTSINAGQYSWNSPYEMTGGPSIRRIIDLANINRSWSILPTGQSGNPFSAHYGDQTESWLNGQYKFLYQDSTLFQESPFKTMTLEPES